MEVKSVLFLPPSPLHVNHLRLRNIRYTFNLVMFLIVWRLIYLKSQIARNLWQTFIGLCFQSLAKLGVPIPYW